MTPYVYQPLNKAADEIRMIKLFPSRFDDEIRFEILYTALGRAPLPTPNLKNLEEIQKTLPAGWNVFETLGGRYLFEDEPADHTTWTQPDIGLNDSPTKSANTCDQVDQGYEALSYAWGEEGTPNCDAYIKSLEDSNSSARDVVTLALRPNLANALRHLRYHDQPRILWVDAVCINQNDLLERNEQVLRMGDIYKHARRVVVWLGSAQDDSTLALQTMQYIGEQVQVARARFRLRAPEAIEREWYRGRTNLPLDQKASRAIQTLLQRSWFKRLWIWQEIQLANSEAVLQCGRDRSDWDVFRRAVILLYEKLELPAPLSRNDLATAINLAWHNTDQSLSTLLLCTARAACLDPRDKVYALLGLTDTPFRQLIQPNYRLSVAQVYEKAVVAHIRYSGDLQILSHCSAVDKNPTWPSWVPQLLQRRSTLVQSLSILSDVTCAASVLFEEPGVLEAKGVLCGIVRRRQARCDDTVSTIRDWVPKNLRLTTYCTGENLLDVYLKTLCAGYIQDLWKVSSCPTLQECRQSYSRIVDEALAEPKGIRGDGNFKRTVGECIENHLFIETEQYIGLGPTSIRLGKKYKSDSFKFIYNRRCID
jgi:hypothetical protein